VTLTSLQKHFEEAKSNHIAFSGKCHDCKKPVTVNIDLLDKNGKGEVKVEGGGIFHFEEGDLYFLKCDECYKKDSTLHNFRPCSVYSRVVGYYRPTSAWNDGKLAEFGDRKSYNLPGEGE